MNDLRYNLNTINDATREVLFHLLVFSKWPSQSYPSPYLFCNLKQQVKESAKLRQIMQTILTLGNALNQGTARGRSLTLVATDKKRSWRCDRWAWKTNTTNYLSSIFYFYFFRTRVITYKFLQLMNRVNCLVQAWQHASICKVRRNQASGFACWSNAFDFFLFIFVSHCRLCYRF